MREALDLRLGTFNQFTNEWTWINLAKVHAMAVLFDNVPESRTDSMVCDCKRIWEAYAYNRDLPHEFEKIAWRNRENQWGRDR